MEVANVELDKTKKYESSAKATWCIRCQVICVIALLVVLLVKVATNKS